MTNGKRQLMKVRVLRTEKITFLEKSISSEMDTGQLDGYFGTILERDQFTKLTRLSSMLRLIICLKM